MDINKALRSVVSTGKVYFGIKEAKKVLKAGQAKLVIISSNCPKSYIEELKGFKKVKLEPSAKETVIFELGKNDLSFYDEKSSSWIAEKGQFNILVGSSSRDIRLEEKIEYLG